MTSARCTSFSSSTPPRLARGSIHSGQTDLLVPKALRGRKLSDMSVGVEHMFESQQPGDDGDGEETADAGLVHGVLPTPDGSPEQRIPSAATQAVLESVAEVVLARDWRVLAAKAWERQRAAVTAWTAAARVTATVLGADAGPAEQDSADAEPALALRRSDRAMAFELSG